MDGKNNNGKWKTSVDVFRGYTKEKLEVLDEKFDGLTEQLSEVIDTVSEIKISLIKKEAVKKYKIRLVNAIWGIIGGSGVVVILKLIFPNLLQR